MTPSKPRPVRKPAGTEPIGFSRAILVALVLTAVVIAAYGRVSGHPFINFDDDRYVYQNPHVTRGLTAEGIAWAFTTFHAGNWHPLTWLSHMLDIELFGLSAGRHHITNVVLHVVNTLLLFFVLFRMTGGLWRSALVAGLFALHPLHVESVAWIAERKDLLSSLFFLLTLLAYGRYVKTKRMGDYLLTAAALALGLMAKPMLVTTPFVLLLLDYWPLERLGSRRPGPSGGAKFWTELGQLAREKALLFVLAGMSAIVTFVAQQSSGSVARLEVIPLGSRVANSLAAYFSYLQKMVWPRGLAVMYPYGTAGATGLEAMLGLLLIAGGSAMAVWQAPKRRHLVTGWFWYLGMLVPVIGLVQVGSQSMADRYTYLPLIGPFIIVAWELGRIAERGLNYRRVVAAAGAAALVALGICTYATVGTWDSSITLYEHALQVAPENPKVLLNLGSELAGRGRLAEAIQYYQGSLRLLPDDPRGHAALGLALVQTGENEKAAQHLQRAISLDPGQVKARCGAGIILLRQGKTSEAAEMFVEAVRLDPDDAEARNGLGSALLMERNFTAAIEQFRAAIYLRPGFAAAEQNLRIALSAAQPSR